MIWVQMKMSEIKMFNSKLFPASSHTWNSNLLKVNKCLLLSWAVRKDFCLLFCDCNFEVILYIYFLQIMFSCGNECAWITKLKAGAFITNGDIDELRGGEVQYKNDSNVEQPNLIKSNSPFNGFAFVFSINKKGFNIYSCTSGLHSGITAAKICSAPCMMWQAFVQKLVLTECKID